MLARRVRCSLGASGVVRNPPARPAPCATLGAVISRHLPAPEPRRRWPALVALAVPVVAVVAVLGVRAAGGEPFDALGAGLRVSEVAHAVPGGPGMQFGGGTGGPGHPASGGSSEAMPEPGPYDFTVVCASHRGKGAHLAVAVEGRPVGEVDVTCSDAADLDAAPALTVLRVEALDAAWSYELTSESEAAVTLVVS